MCFEHPFSFLFFFLLLKDFEMGVNCCCIEPCMASVSVN
jgi:hypothetical protein